MTEETFDEILHNIEPPVGQLLADNRTYRVESSDFPIISTKHINALKSFDKFLILTKDGNTVVGGVLFYGSCDIQVVIFPEYRGMHYMSEIHKNGILKSECYPEQKVTLSTDTISSFEDFQMKHHLLSCADLKIANLAEIYKHISIFSELEEFAGLQNRTLEEFEKEFG